MQQFRIKIPSKRIEYKNIEFCFFGMLHNDFDTICAGHLRRKTSQISDEAANIPRDIRPHPILSKMIKWGIIDMDSIFEL